MKGLIDFIKQFLAWLFGLFGLSSQKSGGGKDEADDTYVQKWSGAAKPAAPRTFQEAYDRSWKFLTDITERVLKFFSKPDRDQVHKIGETMHKSGMNYIHEVPNYEQQARKAVGKAKGKGVQR